MNKTKACSAAGATSPLASSTIPRREPTDRDVQIDILFCGVCHSDLHYAHDDWHDVMPTVYPCVPGHEIVGRVTKVGSTVSKFKAGDMVGVGCLVDSDHTCPNCRAGLQQFCPNQVLTYGSPDRHKTAPVTYGGYSDSIVVDEDFVLHIPANLSLAAAAPLLCAGITMVGAPDKPLSVSVFGLIFGRRSFSGSPIGGIPETQEMLDFCGVHNITSDVEIIPIQKINEAYERMVKSDVKYRFSIDMASLKAE